MSGRVEPPRSPQAGFTLVEMMISMGALIGMLWAVMSVGVSSLEVYKSSSSTGRLDDLSRQTQDRMLQLLRSAGRDSFNPNPAAPLSSDSVTFQSAVGFAGGIVWSNSTRIAFRLDAGEADDGVDNDGDGLVDEGQVVLTENVGEVNEFDIVLCNGVPELAEGEVDNGQDDNGNGLVDEAGLAFSFQDDTLQVFLSVASQDEDQNLHERSVDSSITIRNREPTP